MFSVGVLLCGLKMRAALAENEVHTLKEQLENVKCQKIVKESNNNNSNNNNNINSSTSPSILNNNNNSINGNSLSSSINSSINNNNTTSTTTTTSSSASSSSASISASAATTTTTTTTSTSETGSELVDSSEVSERLGRKTPMEEIIMSKEKEVRGASILSSATSLSLKEAAEVSKLIEDISRLQAALSGVKEASAAQMHAMEEQLEQKNRLIHRLELKLEHSSLEEVKRDFHHVEEAWLRPSVHPHTSWPPFDPHRATWPHLDATNGPASHPHTRSMRDGRLGRKDSPCPLLPGKPFGSQQARPRAQDPDFGVRKAMYDVYGQLPHGPDTPTPLRPHLPSPRPAPMASGAPPAWHPSTTCLGRRRRSLERSAQERHHMNSAGQMSPDSGAGFERSDLETLRWAT
ncbi:uncharacterized protein DDB_G0288805-like [Eriocheir sinensis]|uniref:uncharacterized protein DDB_G0288805-like n=1 Tax=Eriocheir sinensis TaxID=95602 RepID=UPI0021C61EF3|nr:uncharacterized protein DDB_G0288805-like [Eriocheir sinensis]